MKLLQPQRPRTLIVTPRTKTTKTRRRRTSTKRTAQHPCDRPDVRAIIFALSALYRAPDDALTFTDYLMHRRELSILLARALSPLAGGRLDYGAERRTG